MEVTKIIHYKAGYEVRTEKYGEGEIGEGPGFTIRSAYTLDNKYIGDPKVARYLIVKRGIMPELSHSDHSVCSIGFNKDEQKWYGWSHRAICGFDIGDKIFEEEYGDEDTLFVEHGNKIIETLEDAKLSAINFAEYVS